MDRIDARPMRPGFGCVWQSGQDEVLARHNIPEPWMIVSLSPLPDFTARPVLQLQIPDTPEGCLSDVDLLCAVLAAVLWLGTGTNILVHCFEGKSRSSYFDIALHMAVLDIPYDPVFALVKAAHPICQPNPGFEAQLRRLEPKIRALGKPL